jgi:hypothetical protein
VKIVWTNHDRGAFAEFMGSDLGAKFIRYLEQQKPDFPEEASDIQAMAITGAIHKGFNVALREIEKMGELPHMPLPQAKYVENVEAD